MALNRRPDNEIAAVPDAHRCPPALRRKIRMGFLLAALLVVVTSGGVANQLVVLDRSISAEALNGTPAPDRGGPEHLLMRMRYALTMGAVLSLAVLGSLYAMIARYILHPLEKTTAAARQMVNGRLDVTVPDQSTGEIGQIGAMLNDMGVNLQELVLLVWNQTGSALHALEGLSRQVAHQSRVLRKADIQSPLQSVRQNLGTMQTVAQSFDLYDVLLTGRKAVAKEDLTDRPPKSLHPPGRHNACAAAQRHAHRRIRRPS